MATLLFSDVTVIADGSSAFPTGASDILINDDRIAAIEPAGTITRRRPEN